MKVDKEYWASDLPLPLSPSEDDVIFFKENIIPGSKLLLGCTKKLIELSDYQMDIDPWYDGKNVIIQDWITNNVYYDNILGDGVLNLTKKLADDVLIMCSKNCKLFIARVFNKKLDTMRIAKNFPHFNDFNIQPTYQKIINEEYSFYIWNFQDN